MRHRRGEEHELRIFCNHFCNRYAAASLLVLPCKLNFAPELAFLVSYTPLAFLRNAHVVLAGRTDHEDSCRDSVPFLRSVRLSPLQLGVSGPYARASRVNETQNPQQLPLLPVYRAALQHSLAVCAPCKRRSQPPAGCSSHKTSSRPYE